MVFQPIRLLESNELIGYEALARFGDDDPAKWFADAIDNGTSFELEMTAADIALDHLPDLPSDLYLAVNFSPSVVMTAGFTMRLCRHDLSRVVLELTEHDPVHDYAAMRAVLGPLRAGGANVCTPVGPASNKSRAVEGESGMRLAVDDLGAGWASMQHIYSLLPDHMKLDISTVSGVDHNRGKRAMTAGMVTFGAKMGIQVLSEGIETEAELVTLRALDVTAGQGWLLGRPGPLP